jgi:hypothetical protein
MRLRSQTRGELTETTGIATIAGSFTDPVICSDFAAEAPTLSSH